MKKIMKYLNIVLSGLLMVSTYSCTKDYEYDPAVDSSTASQAFIYSSAGTSLSFLPDDEQSFIVKLGRSNASSAATVSFSCDNAKFTAPTTVSFAEGEKTVDVKVSFNIPTGNTEKVTFAVGKENEYEYGSNSLTFTIKRDYTWIQLGKGIFSSDFFGIANAGVQIQQAKEQPNRYKLVKPMASDTEDFTEESQLLDYQFVIDPTNAKGGEFVTSPTGFAYGSYGMLYFYLVSMQTDENVVTLNMYICFIDGGNLTPGWYETWTVEIPE